MNNTSTPQTTGTATPAADPAKKGPTSYSYTPTPAKDTSTSKPTAAKGNDEVMSQPAQPAKKS